MTIKGVFAENASTTIPQTPVAGTSYRDDTTTKAEMNAGFPFKTIVDSSKFNEALYEYSAVSKMQEKYGFVPWSNLTDYETGSFCLATNGLLYQALQASGPSSSAVNPVNDTSSTYWKSVVVGSVRNVGELVKSCIPLSDATLNLLDGSVIQGDGMYSEFVTYMAGLVSSHPNIFTTEALWQDAVSTYGVCGKFVYNSLANTIRLPKITGFVEGTTDENDIGVITPAGLPNITGDFFGESYSQNYRFEGAFYRGETGGNPGVGSSDTDNYQTYFDASRSSAVYGNSNTVQPQSIKTLYYIVVANSTKTDIEVDIDEIATDLNAKVDKSDLATIIPVVEISSSGSSWSRVSSDGWCEQGGSGTISGSGNSFTIVLSKEYKDTNYQAIVIANGSSPVAISVNINDTDSFQVYSNATDLSFSWRAYGYLPENNS